VGGFIKLICSRSPKFLGLVGRTLKKHLLWFFMAVAHSAFVNHNPLADFFLGLKREWASFYMPEIKGQDCKEMAA
jgi:hypothetical protein